VDLPIFRDWLNEHAELLLLRQWQDFCKRPKGGEDSGPRVQVTEELSFPISEDDLLAVSQRLVYCGKQKDVAEVRAWLRQFNDDSRIEVAFALLRRMAERGYINEGERVLAIHRLQEAARALGEGEKRVVWRVVRGRFENLCVSFVDSETKSGASTAREVSKILRPGKCAAVSELGTWLHDHLDQDAVLLVVDDFAGTGNTVVKGLERWSRERANEALFRNFCDKGAVYLFFLFAFPRALQAIQRRFPKIRTTAIRVFGEEVLALEPEAGIFSDEGERKFSQDILLQLADSSRLRYRLDKETWVLLWDSTIRSLTILCLSFGVTEPSMSDLGIHSSPALHGTSLRAGRLSIRASHRKERTFLRREFKAVCHSIPETTPAPQKQSQPAQQIAPTSIAQPLLSLL
jgi:hypothetical protein